MCVCVCVCVCVLINLINHVSHCKSYVLCNKLILLRYFHKCIKSIMKKDVTLKSKAVAKKWLDGRLMVIMTIQVYLVPNPMEKATQIHLNCHYY